MLAEVTPVAAVQLQHDQLRAQEGGATLGVLEVLSLRVVQQVPEVVLPQMPPVTIGHGGGVCAQVDQPRAKRRVERDGVRDKSPDLIQRGTQG